MSNLAEALAKADAIKSKIYIMFSMLSETIKLCKRTIGWIKTNNRELYLTAVIILVATISFGLGRLSKIREEKTPITIENVGTSTEIIANTTNSQRATLTVGANKIFVASRNGKNIITLGATRPR